MIASGIMVSSKVRPAVSSRSTSTIALVARSGTADSEILSVSATVSGVNVARMAASISAAPMPKAIHVPTIAPMLLPLTQSTR